MLLNVIQRQNIA